jgi:hypothetical protein
MFGVRDSTLFIIELTYYIEFRRWAENKACEISQYPKVNLWSQYHNLWISVKSITKRGFGQSEKLVKLDLQRKVFHDTMSETNNVGVISGVNFVQQQP